MKADPERDFIRLGEDFYIGFLSMVKWLMRASSYEVLDLFGWKSSPTTWKK